MATRRSFLQLAALLPACLFLTHPSSEADQANLLPIPRVGPGRLKLALNAYSFSKLLNDNAKGRANGFSLFHLIDFCAKYEVDGLDATGYFFPGYPNVPDDQYLFDFKRRAFNCGIGISGTGVRNNFTTADKAVRDASVEHIKQWVEVASRLGAPVLRIFADTQMKAQTWETISNGAKREDVENWIADDVRRCAEHAQKFGIIIGVQNHGDFLKTSGDHLSLLKRINHTSCGIIVDTGYYKSPDPYEDMAATAPYAVNWQIKESPIKAGSEIRTDLNRLLTIIRKAGYRGYIPIETLSSSAAVYDPFAVVPKFLAQVKEAMAATADVQSTRPDADLVIPLPNLGASPSATQPTSQPSTRPTTNPTTRPAGRKPPNKKKTAVPKE